MRRLQRIAAIGLVLGLLGAAGGYYWTHGWLNTPMAALREPITFDVPRGASLRTIAAALYEQGVLAHPQIWSGWARMSGRAGSLKAGEYRLQPGLTPRELLELLNSGRVLLHSITFVEGATFRDVRNVLLAHEAVKNEYSERSGDEIMRALGAPGLHPEGQFFPDTYYFPRDTTDIELLGVAHKRLRPALEQAWAERAADLPLATQYAAPIPASTVEKEAALDRERPQIAGVFVERLRRGMRLQTDPTVIYGMLDAYDGNIRRADLTRDTPYNTYTRAGLPPTPIAMPGLDSLRAAVQPEITGALF